MIATATTTVTVLADDSAGTDTFGDPVADNTPTAVRVPASILEQRQATTTRADDRAQTVRSYTARLPADLDIAAGARLRDETTGVLYVVDAVTQPANPFHTNDIRCDLRRVT